MKSVGLALAVVCISSGSPKSYRGTLMVVDDMKFFFMLNTLMYGGAWMWCIECCQVTPMAKSEPFLF
jgi:hypothetical protein